MTFIDTHCHIHEIEGSNGEVYKKWRSDGTERTGESVLKAAREVGVERLIVIGTSLKDSELAVQFAQAHENVWASIGIHPHAAKDHARPEMSSATEMSSELIDPEIGKRFAKLAENPKVVAIGECGLDYYYEYSPREYQAAVLRFQIETAVKRGLPLSFHVREAFDDFWPILDGYTNIKGVLHSFTDSRSNMERAINMGLYIGVSGIATFTKNEEQIVTYRTIPQRSLLLETDAPFLTPTPLRGKICEPKHVVHTAEFLAKLRGVGVAEIAAATTKNAVRLFGLSRQL